MPLSTGVVQEAGVPRRPSISTRHRRQEPKASRLSVAQSFGTLTPRSVAARMTEVPAGTVTDSPSISRVTIVSERRAGVPWSSSLIRGIATLLGLFGRYRRGDGRLVEILGEMTDRAQHGIGREPAQRAQRSVQHQLAEIVEQ